MRQKLQEGIKHDINLKIQKELKFGVSLELTGSNN